MAKMKNGNVRRIKSVDEAEPKKAVDTQKGAKLKTKTKPKSENVTVFGSGRGNIQKSGKNHQIRKKFPKIQNVEKTVLQSIIGQDRQVRQIITAIYRAINFKSIKSNVLIIGSSGTGKTETIRQVAKRLHIPYTIEDATKYTQEGYYGADVNDMIYNLIENAKKDMEKAQNGIIIIDEIDKKRDMKHMMFLVLRFLKVCLRLLRELQ